MATGESYVGQQAQLTMAGQRILQQLILALDATQVASRQEQRRQRTLSICRPKRCEESPKPPTDKVPATVEYGLSVRTRGARPMTSSWSQSSPQGDAT